MFFVILRVRGVLRGESLLSGLSLRVSGRRPL